MTVIPPESPIPAFALERYFARWEFAAPYLLCTSDIQGYGMGELLALADDETRGLWENLTLGYTESTGHPLLRAEIAGLYERIAPEQVLCFAGAEEAIYIAMRVLLRPGDHMITTFPGYQSSYQIAEALGAQVSRWTLRPVEMNGRLSWQADLDELRRSIRPNTRMILVNFPHNPTGALPGHEDWAEIVRIAQEAGCWLFSDEVYRLLEYDPAARLTAAVDAAGDYDRVLSLGVMSKPFALAGLRIGWAASRSQALLSEMAAYKDYTTICNSAPSEVLALIGLRAREAVLARSMGILRANLALVEAFMADHPGHFAWAAPRAGSIAFPRWLGSEPVEAFTDRLVQETGVLLLPGTVYDIPGGYFRMGLGRTNAGEALERLRSYLRQR
jgi:aspartate/methionine/tyrosine aminotransferase